MAYTDFDQLPPDAYEGGTSLPSQVTSSVLRRLKAAPQIPTDAQPMGDVTGLAHNSITGIGRVAGPTPGMWGSGYNAPQGNFPDAASGTGVPKSVAQGWSLPDYNEPKPTDPAFDKPGLVMGGSAWAPDAQPPKAETDSSGGKPGAPLDITPTPNGSNEFPHKDEVGGLAGKFAPGLVRSLLQNTGNFFDANRMTLMALAGGLAGSQNFGQGLGRGFTAAAATVPQQNALNNQNATISYLTRAGLPPDLARSISSNPALMQGVLGEMTGLEPPKTQTLQGPMGASLMQWNPQTRKWENALGGGTGASGNLPGGWEQMTPEQRLASLDPVTRGMVETLHQGGAPPPGRMAYVMGLAQQIWPGYTENDYNAAKTMAQDLQKSSPSSQGGLISNGMSAFGHLGELGDAMVGVGALNGPNIPGGGIIGQAGNYGRSLLASPDLKGSQSQEADTALKYGEEGTKFYAATGGGEAERTAALNNATGPGKLSTEKAGYLRSELGLMQRRMQDQLSKLESNPAGQQWLANPANQARIQQMGQDMARVKHAIAQLDPTGPEAAQERAKQAPQAQAAPQQQAAGTDPISQARAAIARGADRNAVIQRLQKMGINPAGL